MNNRTYTVVVDWHGDSSVSKVDGTILSLILKLLSQNKEVEAKNDPFIEYLFPDGERIVFLKEYFSIDRFPDDKVEDVLEYLKKG